MKLMLLTSQLSELYCDHEYTSLLVIVIRRSNLDAQPFFLSQQAMLDYKDYFLVQSAHQLIRVNWRNMLHLVERYQRR